MFCSTLGNSSQIPVKLLRLKHWKKNHFLLKTDYGAGPNSIKERTTKQLWLFSACCTQPQFDSDIQVVIHQQKNRITLTSTKNVILMTQPFLKISLIYTIMRH